MKRVKAEIILDKSPEEACNFALNPENTPKWIPSILEEKTNEWPARVGTMYRSRGNDGKWSEYVLTEINYPSYFVHRKQENGMEIKYSFVAEAKERTKLEYSIESEHELPTSLTDELLSDLLKSFKAIIEIT